MQPDVAAWTREPNPVARLTLGLSDLYRFYRGGEAMLTNVLRDWEVLPEQVRQSNQDTDAHLRDVLLDAVCGTRQQPPPAAGGAGARCRLSHLAFSLCGPGAVRS